MSIKHEAQRIGVFVDVQNMYYSARNIYDSKVNFKEILNTAIAGRQLIRAEAYVISTESGEEQTFFDALAGFGFKINEKELKTFYGGAKKGDWDVGIAVDMVRSKNLDVLVLVSGDGDFRDVVEYSQNNGQQVEVIAFGKSTASELKEVADVFVDLDEDKKYLIGSGGGRRSNGGGRKSTKSSGSSSKSGGGGGGSSSKGRSRGGGGRRKFRETASETAKRLARAVADSDVTKK